tara:strand:- start:2638 stop:4809 length:2172 start_codon:yes stop_codon:yes gene_type:complete
MSLQNPSATSIQDMYLVPGSDYVRMASNGGGLLSIKLPASGDSTPVVESLAGGLIAASDGTYIDEGRLGATLMRESGDGTNVPLPNNVMMYNPNSTPKEITYSNDIPLHLNIIDASFNIVDTSFSIIDTSLNVHDVSLNTLDTQVTNLMSQGGGGASFGSTIAIGSGSNATGTNSVAIGNNASTSTYDNSVALGNGSTSGADNTIILGDGTQNVGIGTSNPLGNLHISSGTDGKCVLILEADTDNNNEADQGRIIFRQDGGLDLNAVFVSNQTGTYHNYLNLASSSNDPAILFRVDTNDDAINATERMRIASNGNVGIGTTSPSSKLQITDGSCKIEQTGTNNNSLIINPNNHNYGVDIEVFQSDSPVTKKSLCLNPYGGSVGIGTTNPLQKLHVESGNIIAYSNQHGVELAQHEIKMTRSGAAHWSLFNTGYFKITNTSNNNNAGTNGTDYFTMDTTGKVGIGSNVIPSMTLNVRGGSRFGATNAAHYTQFNHDQSWHMECYLSNSGHTFYINYYVQKTVYLNRTSYGSDIRIKENILDVDDESALNMIRNIQPKTYEYKVQKDRGRVYGFIAQQIKEVIPEAVTLHKLHAPFDSSEFQNVSIDEDIVTLSSSISIFEIGKVFEFKHLDSNELFQLTVTEIIDDLHFKIDLEGKGDRVPNNALLVGEGVDDFHLLDKNYIFTVATAALQEVDRQLQAEKAKTATLEAQMADVLARLSALENP